MSIPSPADGSATSKCGNCGAAVSSKAKFCEECGAIQTASQTGSSEQVGKVLPDSAVSGIESQSSASTPSSSIAENQTSESPETEGADERASKREWLFIVSGIAVVAIVSACIVWFNGHPIGAKAQYELGVKYATGKGVQQDEVKAALWFRKSAEQGEADAQCWLGVMYENGRGGLAKDDAEAASWFRKAAEQGYVVAQYNLGVMHFNEGSIVKDDAEAAFWFKKAAEQGYAEAQNNLGSMYSNGQGSLAKDEPEAVSWYRKAAEQGNADGQHNLAGMYDEGKGVPKDESEAVRWWRKAAVQGNAESQYNLGVMYEHGEGGLTQDDAQAVSWYQKAADQGYSHATDALANVRARQQREQESATASRDMSGTDSGVKQRIEYADGLSLALHFKGVKEVDVFTTNYEYALHTSPPPENERGKGDAEALVLWDSQMTAQELMNSFAQGNEATLRGLAKVGFGKVSFADGTTRCTILLFGDTDNGMAMSKFLDARCLQLPQ